MSQSTQPTLLCVASQKGGVGKTTTAISLAHKLALLGHETMLVDLDAQGHAAISLGMNPEPCVFDWLTETGDWSLITGDKSQQSPVTGHQSANAIRATGRSLLSLVPGDSRTRQAEQLMALQRVDLAAKLRSLTAAIVSRGQTRPAYIVFDTAAGGVLQEAVLCLADIVVIPVRMESLGMDGVAATLGILGQLRTGDRSLMTGDFRATSHQSSVTSRLSMPEVIVLPVAYRKGWGEHEYQYGSLRDLYRDQVADPIPARIAVAEAVACGQTVFEYESHGIGDVRKPYGALVERILGVRDGA